MIITTLITDTAHVPATVPDLIGTSVLVAAAVLRLAGLSAVYINKVGEAGVVPPLGRRVKALFPPPQLTVSPRGIVTVHTT